MDKWVTVVEIACTTKTTRTTATANTITTKCYKPSGRQAIEQF